MRRKKEIYEAIAVSDKKADPLGYNRDGDELEDGMNLRAGVKADTSALKADMSARRSFHLYLNPEARGEGAIMKKAYAKVVLGGIYLHAGRDSMWWGPGIHGSLLLSNNARPLTFAGIGSGRPAYLPWLFRHLGLFRFSAFAARLDRDRTDVQGPYLWGMRLNFKPSSYLELGLQRTALLGGRGRSEDAEAWWSSLTGRGENDLGREAGDQRAGLDMKITLPFDGLPVQLYAEAAGEDSCGGLPCRWAYLGGVYLPRLLGMERLDVRAEYAVNRVKGEPDVWYNHHIYTSGYTYHGRIIGHHMGTDSEDYFMELGYRLQAGRLHLSYDLERHGDMRTDEVSTGGGHDINGDLGINWRLALGRLKDSAGRAEGLSLLSLGLRYSF